MALASAVAATAVSGCDDGGAKTAKAVPKPAVPAAPKVRAVPARPRDVAVIRRWVDSLRAGQVKAASSYFSLPVLVSNGTPDLSLTKRAEVRAFNASLPCGATLLEARRTGDYTIAVFRLTDRPGGDCGTGSGQRAATAFRFRRGRISEWRRVAVPQFVPSNPPPSREV
jgi:hypothetical protein